MTERTGEAPAPISTWAPLRDRAFRALWLALVASNIGTWMQTVGAQWLLVDEPNASTLVALVQTATTLPALLLSLPAGVLADSFDRRRLLIAVQAFQVVVGTVLTVLTATGQMPPALLLTFTFLLGAGAALTLPAWQALIPDLVPRPQLPAAATLGGISVNVARAIGPAVAGVLIAQVSVAAVFALNAATFTAFALVLAWWRPPEGDGPAAPEPFVSALRAGGRFVRHSPVVRRILLRATLFIVPGTVLWALLPLIATRRLNLDASGYGVLLGALGVGAVSGAFALPRLRARLSTNRLLVAASLVYALALAVVVLVPVTAVVIAVLVPAGLAWIAVLSSVNAAIQLFLPGWVRARGLSAYQVTLLGGQAVAAFCWGLVAEHTGLMPTFLLAAGLMVAGAATTGLWPLIDTSGLDRSPAAYWPEPRLAFEPEPEAGPVVVTVTYTVAAANERPFLDAMSRVRRSRQRTGAIRWGLYRNGETPHCFTEIYVVSSWAEHLRQHEGRLTGSDQVNEARARELCEAPPEVSHLFPAEPMDPPLG